MWLNRFFCIFSPNNPEYHHHHHHSSSPPRRRTEYERTSSILPHEINQTEIFLPKKASLSSSKVKWIDAVRTVTEFNQVRLTYPEMIEISKEKDSCDIYIWRHGSFQLIEGSSRVTSLVEFFFLFSSPLIIFGDYDYIFFSSSFTHWNLRAICFFFFFFLDEEKRNNRGGKKKEQNCQRNRSVSCYYLEKKKKKLKFDQWSELYLIELNIQWYE